jgi:hypothetical protein
MSDFIDIVLCKVDGKPKLYHAPSFSHLMEGDRVIIEGETEPVEVLKSVSMNPRDDDFKMLVMATEAERPLKRIAAKIFTIEFEWKEDNEDE